jgi:hypothetical protein
MKTPANPENVPLDKIPSGWRLIYEEEYQTSIPVRVWNDGKTRNRFSGDIDPMPNFREYTYITPDLPNNGQPWHAHKPGDPAPVEDGVNVDIVCRNGLVFSSQLSPEWRATTRGELDILFYRLHDPAPMKTESTTFEAHGHTWFRHTPGDPCPVDNHEYVCVYLDDQTSTIWPKPAMAWSWKKDNPSATIIGWRRATMTAVPSECPPSVSSDRILSILIAAGHITEEQVEQARKLVKP